MTKTFSFPLAGPPDLSSSFLEQPVNKQPPPTAVSSESNRSFFIMVPSCGVVSSFAYFAYFVVSYLSPAHNTPRGRACEKNVCPAIPVASDLRKEKDAGSLAPTGPRFPAPPRCVRPPLPISPRQTDRARRPAPPGRPVDRAARTPPLLAGRCWLRNRFEFRLRSTAACRKPARENNRRASCPRPESHGQSGPRPWHKGCGNERS